MGCVALAAGFAGLAPVAHGQTVREQVMLVLDASGSMWGQIDGVSKIEIAREQIADMVGDWDPEIDLGLISYGHRARGQCDDVEIVRAPGPVDAGSFTAAVNGLSPLGMTPLSDSVRLAAETMRYSEQKATVILLSDGLENCEADPCALAAELEGAGIDFTAHVIGFDVDAADAAELSCLADTTGGEFFLAGNADTLTASLRQTVEAIAQPVVEPEPEVVVAEPEPEPEPEPQGPTGLIANAKLCETCDILTKGVFWRLYTPEAAADASAREIAANGSAEAEFEIEPGQYVIRARVGDVQRDMPVTVEAGQMADAVVNLQAGNLRVRAEASPGGTVLDNKMFYSVLAPEPDLNGEREQITASGSAEGNFTLSSGMYHVVAKHGDALATQDVEVREGALTDVVIDMNVGYARVSAVPTAGAAKLTDSLYYVVYNQATDLQGNRVQVTASGSAETLFRLPAGDYLVVGRHGDAFAEQAFSVRADALIDVSLDMNVGYLRVTTALADGLPPVDRGVYYWVNAPTPNLSGERDNITANGSANALFRLPAGEYQLVSRLGDAFTSVDVSVTAGQLQELTVVQDAALLRAQAVTQEGGAALTGGLFWALLAPEADLNGNRAQISATGAAQTQMFVKAGQYILQARHNNESFDFPITLNPGEVRDVTVLLSR